MLRRRELLKLESLESRACPAAASLVAPLQIAEGGAAKAITVTLDAPSSKAVSVDYLLQGNATPSRDFTLSQGSRTAAQPRGTLTFAPGQTQRVLSLAAIDDTLREGSESLTITLISPKGCTLGAARSATVTLRDNDAYTAVIDGPAVVAAGSAATYTLRLSSPATRNETFYVSTAPGTAAPGSDFSPLTNMPVVIAVGGTSKQFSVQTRANSAGETDETFGLTAVASTNGFPAIPTLNILIPGGGPNPTVPRISVSDVSVIEGNSGTTTAQFVISLTTASPNLVSVSYVSRDGTATVADNDYSAVSGAVSFAPGETQRLVSVPILGDVRPEADESLSLVLSAPVNGVLSDGEGVCIIRNDDANPVDPTGFQIQVDYIGNVRQAIRDACDWAAQRWSQVIVGDLPGVSDPRYGYTDDFRITVQEGLLGGAMNGVGGTLANARALQFRSDSAGLPWLGETGIDPFDATDPQLRNVVLHEFGHALGFGGMWLQKGLVRDASPNAYTANPTYVGVNAIREYNRIFGQTGTTMPVENMVGSVIGTVPGSPNDGTYGVHWRESTMDNELMTGFSEAAGVTMPLSAITVGAMQDLGYQVNYGAADPYSLPSPAITWSVSDMTVTEGNTGVRTALVTVSLSFPANLPLTGSVSVTIALVPGSATPGLDYINSQPSSVTVTWNGGPSPFPPIWSGLIIIGDTLVEPNETLFVVISNPTGGSVIGRSTATVTILNDDGQNGMMAARTLLATAASTRESLLKPLPQLWADESGARVGGDVASDALPRRQKSLPPTAWRDFTSKSWKARMPPKPEDESSLLTPPRQRLIS